MSRKRKTSLAMLAAGVGGTAVAGIGLSLGRDVYKSSKKNGGGILLFVAVLSAIILPFLGGRGMVRGHDRGLFGTIFKTVIWNLLLISIAFFLAFLALSILAEPTKERPTQLFSPELYGAAFTASITLFGMLIGLFQRSKRLNKFAVIKANANFLAEEGFQETDGTDITHYDQNGQGLRFLEAHKNRLVFMPVGRRGKRAFIELDDDGRMIAYTGVV